MQVTVVGGTHGNELIGIHLLQEWQNNPPSITGVDLDYIFANPQAIDKNQRYIETDLNRCFSHLAIEDPQRTLYEEGLAKEWVTKYKEAPPELLVDLHNTTSNMGMTLILSREKALENPKMLSLLTYLNKRHSIYILNQPQTPNPYLPSLGQMDITVEAGPLPHGTLNADIFFQVKALVNDILNWAQSPPPSPTGSIEVYEFWQNLDYPRTSEGKVQAMLHPNIDGKDYTELQNGDPLFIDFEGKTQLYTLNEPSYPVFINEQAYYEKGIAMTLTKKRVLTFDAHP